MLRVVTEELNALRTDPDLDPLKRARAVAMLGAIALRAHQLDTLEARVEALEAALEQRANP